MAADGRELAIKIQYPGVAKSIDSDLNNLAGLLRMARILPVEIDISEILAEAKRQLRQEADYRAGSRAASSATGLVADEPDVFVPRVYHDLTTKRVLAMEKATAARSTICAAPSTRSTFATRWGSSCSACSFASSSSFASCRPIRTSPTTSSSPISGRLVLLDFGSVREYSEEFVEKYRQAVSSRDSTRTAGP